MTPLSRLRSALEPFPGEEWLYRWAWNQLAVLRAALAAIEEEPA